MALALWALVITLGTVFVAFLCEDLAQSSDKEVSMPFSEDWTEVS